jgi:hypothetical protein
MPTTLAIIVACIVAGMVVNRVHPEYRRRPAPRVQPPI